MTRTLALAVIALALALLPFVAASISQAPDATASVTPDVPEQAMQALAAWPASPR